MINRRAVPNTMRLRWFVSIGLGAILFCSDALARIKLITLPVRERVEVQLDHPDVTLVEEERIVPLVKGINQIDFSWANTRIVADTLVFRVLPDDQAESEAVNVLSVSYPPAENALVWSVAATASVAARVRISYVLAGLEKRYHYRAIAANDESQLTLSQYMRIDNVANEDYADSYIWTGFGEQINKPIGLNETKEVLVAKYRQVPIAKTYTADAVQYGYLDRRQNKLNVPMHYVLVNNEANGLGVAPLPYGKARLFQRDSAGTVAFIGEDWGQFTPVDDELQLYLGLARDIVVKRTVARSERKRLAGNLYQYDIVMKYEIENFKAQAARLKLVESVSSIRAEAQGGGEREPEWVIGEETTFEQGIDEAQSDVDKLVFYADLPARQAAGKVNKTVHQLHLLLINEW